MKCLVYTGPYQIIVEERPMPTIADGEVLLKIDAVGICGSDMHCFHGHDPRRKPGLVLGHEFAGTVVESRAPAYTLGKRVTGNPMITCSYCNYCVQGRNNLCENRTMVGMTRAGAYAEYMAIPATSLIDIPQDMPAVHAALTEPAATALHAITISLQSMARPLPENRVLIIGGGAIGFLAALLLRHYGCRNLVLAETNDARRSLAEQHANVTSYNPRAQNTADSVFSYVIDAVGNKHTRQMAMQAVSPGGVVMHIGLQDWESEIDMRKLTLAEVALLGAYTYSTADLRSSVRLLHEGGFGDLSWLETMPLSKGPAAFAALDKGTVAASKVLLLPDAA